ncbi:MAG: hypothetical protein ABI203_07815 [Mucilaginibacter sp.]
MKKLCLIALMVILAISAKSQEHLGKSLIDINQYISGNDGYVETRYTKDGIKFLFCTFSLKRIDATDIGEIAFYLDDSDSCYMYITHFQNQKALDGLVTLTKLTPGYFKIENKFAWTNPDRRFDMEIKIDDDNSGFMLIYTKNKSQ